MISLTTHVVMAGSMTVYVHVDSCIFDCCVFWILVDWFYVLFMKMWIVTCTMSFTLPRMCYCFVLFVISNYFYHLIYWYFSSTMLYHILAIIDIVMATILYSHIVSILSVVPILNNTMVLYYLYWHQCYDHFYLFPVTYVLDFYILSHFLTITHPVLISLVLSLMSLVYYSYL